MDKVFTTALLIVVSMIMVVVLFNVAYPAVAKSSDAVASMAERADERLLSQIEIIHATAELNSDGWWQDTNGNGLFDTFVWVKNTGSTRIVPGTSMDVFFGAEGDFVRIQQDSIANGSYPNWSWQVENGTNWDPSTTLLISIHYQLPLPRGRYFIKVVTPGGVSSDFYIGM